MCCDPRRRRARLTVLAVLGALALPLAAALVAGCGKRGVPLPPLRNVPIATRDLEVRQQGSQILLEMTYPATTVAGQPLGGVDAVELLGLAKEALAGGAPPPIDPRELEAGAGTLLTLRGTELEAAVVGERIQLRVPLAEELPEEPMANVFAVRTWKGDERSAISNSAILIPVAPPPPPRALEITPRPGGIQLTWEVDEDVAGEIAGFDVFRRDARSRGYDRPLRRLPSDARQFVDRGAVYGRDYIYTVRTVVSTEPLIQSDAAGEREVAYEDRFPPPLPQNFVALAERGAIRLRWDPSRADDVAGYVIYRREPAREFHPITETPVSGTEYLDTELPSGLSYDYQIQVVDNVGNRSRRSNAVTATTR